MTAEGPGDDELGEVLFTEAEIAAAVERMAERVAADYRGNPIVLVGVMKGALFFIADFARALGRIASGPSEIYLDLIVVSSYGEAKQSSGAVRCLGDASVALEGRHALIVEDVVDNGFTLAYVQKLFRNHGPKSLRTCVLVDKPARRVVDVTLDYVGLTCPDAFIVGYGLDYQEKYRNLPYLARLRPLRASKRK